MHRPQITYVCRVQSCVLRLPKYWPPTPLSTQRVCPPPAPKGYTLAGRWGGGVSIFWKTPAIGFASYSIISLRHRHSKKYSSCEIILLNVQEEKVKWEAGVKRGKVSSSFPLLNSIFPSFSLTRIHSFDSIARSTMCSCARTNPRYNGFGNNTKGVLPERNISRQKIAQSTPGHLL